RTRTVSPALRRALELRDRGCRFPDHSPAASGARACRFTDAHHIVHWADGGRTDLQNLVLLCRRHHRAVHEGGMRVCLDREGRVVFFDRRGRAVFDAPRRGMPRRGMPRREMAPRKVPPRGLPRRERLRNGGPVTSGSPTLPASLPSPMKTASSSPWPGPIVHWRHDRDIPWAIEARAREALDSG
ncbi:MAG: HNH endonuclease signature motif containing protein, partial [Longimicrobiales bacterium]|nr:HNH endonuclease signature motif containing protein [Longimicrobiales bacterium]